MPDEVKIEETKTEKPWYKKFKVITGIATVVLDTATILVSQYVADPATKATILKMLPIITTVGVAIITGHTITESAVALRKK